jgi:hypothetical protein
MKKIIIIMLLFTAMLLSSMGRVGDIVKDSDTDLEWQDGAGVTTMEWNEAIVYCQNMMLQGKSDWRLPNLRELTSLVDHGKHNPSIDAVFEHTKSDNYWSSTTYAGSSSYAWDVGFYHGSHDYHDKNTKFYTRCVR